MAVQASSSRTHARCHRGLAALTAAARPSHILLRSPGPANPIDDIPNAVRFPALYDAVTTAYHPVEEIDGFVIGRCIDAADP